MLLKESKQILNTSIEAAKFLTNIEGWVGGGRFFGKDERAARWSGCTHIICPDCGKPTPKMYTRCSDCREKNAIKRYEARERKRWDRETPLYSDAADSYFFDEQELMYYLEDSFNLKSDVALLRLVICEPIYLRQVEEDYFCGELTEDGELSEAVIDALNNLNTVIQDEDPVSWFPGKYAAVLT